MTCEVHARLHGGLELRQRHPSSGRGAPAQGSRHRARWPRVIIVEDIVDTGLTLTYLQDILRARGPRTLKTACLLSKPSRRQIDVQVDYIGFTIDDLFVVGYGLDSGEHYRNLPYHRGRQRLVRGRFHGRSNLRRPRRASAITAVASSVSTLRSRISTLPFTIVFCTSSP